jgi:hypothetical protein
LGSLSLTTASIESTSSSRAPSCAHDSMALSYVRGFKCAYINIGNPDHDINHGVPSHDYVNKGCSTHCSPLPRHRHKGYHSSVSSTVQATVTQLRPRRSRSDCGGCQPVGFYVYDFSPVCPSATLQLFTSLPLQVSGAVLEI